MNVTDIASAPSKVLRERLEEIRPELRAYLEAIEDGKSADPIPAAVEERTQILIEYRKRRVGYDTKMIILQWDAHHFAEDVLQTASDSESGVYVEQLIDGLIKFRQDFGIQSCPSCP